MKKVLLAIDGISPNHKVFHFAIQFCKRIKAELNVFQIINPRNFSEYLKKIRYSAENAGGYFSRTMVAATFAEAGDHETAKEIMSAAQKNYNRLLSETDIFLPQVSTNVGVYTHPYSTHLGNHTVTTRLAVENVHVIRYGIQGCQVVFNYQDGFSFLRQFTDNLHGIQDS